MATKRRIISIHEKKKPSFTLGKFIFWMLLIAFFGGIIYSLFFSGFLAVNQIEINGLNELDRKNIDEVVNSKIEGKYLKMIDKNNLLLVSNRTVENELLKRFVKIENVRIIKKFPHGLIVNIEERESSMVLCPIEDCFMIDKAGISFSKVDYSLPEIRENKLVWLRDLSDKAVNIGSETLSSEYLKFILAIEDKMKSELDISMEKNYETPSRVSADIRGKTQDGWKIYFNENIDLQKEINMLGIVLSEKIGDRRQDLDYIDLRADNKVYYKFKQGTQEEMNKDEEGQPSQPAEKKAEENGKKKKKK
jgi:cell division septal protein FtsQ